MKFLAGLLSLSLLATPAAAQVAISGLPAASTLGGTELVPVVQAGITSKTTTGSFAALTVAVPNTWALGQVFSGGTSSTPPFSLTSGTNLTAPAAGAFEWDGSNIYVTQTSGPTRKTLLFSDLSNISGTLGISHGGSGQTTAAAALSAYGGAPLAGATFTGKVVTPASGTGGAGLNLPHGAAPTSPVNGDVWTTTGGIYVRINGATVGPLAAAPAPPLAWTLVSTQTASSSASLSWSTTALTGYTDLKLVVNATACASSSIQSITLTDTLSNVVSNLSDIASSASTNPAYGNIWLPNWHDNSVFLISSWRSGTQPFGMNGSTGGFSSAGTIVSIALVCNTGNIATGSASLYGR